MDGGSSAFGSSLMSGGVVLPDDAASLGVLTNSSGDLGDIVLLRQRMARDGYLFLPGALNRDAVLRAREEITKRLRDGGFLAPGTDPMDAVASSAAGTMDRAARAALTRDNAALAAVLYAGPMKASFDPFRVDPARPYDVT